jgi:predicted dehydrogenase
MSQPLGVAVIGAGGSIAQAHLYAYSKSERARLTAVVDIDEDRARSAAERFGGADVLTDYREVLARDDISAISICTPPSSHVPLSIEALRAGKHVLCEKPVAPSLAGLDLIDEAARSSGAVFSGVFQLRFGRGAQQLRHAVDEGRLGDIHLGLAETLWYRDEDYFSVPWRATWADQCGGVTVSQAIHLIDALIWYMGTPVSVSAAASSPRGLTECEETAVALIRFESGAIGQITSTTISAGPERSRLELFGTRASAISTGPVYEATAEPFLMGMVDEQAATQLTAELEERFPRGFRMLHRPQVEDFLSAIEEGRPPEVGCQECRAALHVTSGIYKSAMTGAVVDLPLQPDDPWYNATVPAGFGLG